MAATAEKIQRHPALSRLNDPRLLRELAYVDGKWCAADSRRSAAVNNPSDGAYLGAVPDMGAAEAKAAVTRAADRVRAERIDLIDALCLETGCDRADIAPAFSLDPAITAAAAHLPLLEEPVARALGQIGRLG